MDCRFKNFKQDINKYSQRIIYQNQIEFFYRNARIVLYKAIYIGLTY